MERMNALRIFTLVDRIVAETERSIGPRPDAALLNRVVELRTERMKLTLTDIAPVVRLVRDRLDRHEVDRAAAAGSTPLGRAA
jgi:hypothetical protein